LVKQIAEQTYDYFNQFRIKQLDQEAGDFEKIIEQVSTHEEQK